MQYESKIYINNSEISLSSPTYFIADIASNHDGDLERAKDLIYLAKEAKADAVKFQHFLAEKIVSDVGFKKLGSNLSHQSAWKKSIFKVYKQYECKREWTDELYKTACKAGIDIFTTPYDYDAIELWNNYVSAYKVGSGDITWIDFLEKIASKAKPILLSTGASTMEDVERAVNSILKYNKKLILLQCNTNYTGSLENFKYVNLNVLKTFSQKYPGMILGFSDHTPRHVAVLGAVALGARVIEKHFTDNNSRIGPDHSFSLNPFAWKEMVEETRVLESAFGDGIKRIEDNETDTAVIQRRSISFSRDIRAGELIKENDLIVLRPAPKGSFEPFECEKLIGKKLKIDKIKGEALFRDEIL